MMNKYKIRIFERLLHKTCPTNIPRSGEKGKKVNCYSISLYAGNIPLLLVEKINENGFFGFYFESNRFNPEACIPFSLMYGVSIRIEHYYGLYSHVYNGLFDYLWHEWTGLYKAQTFFASAKLHIPKYLFNQVALQLPSRMKILEKIIDRQSVYPQKPFDHLDIMSHVYGLRWYSHPQRKETSQKMHLYLDSFVASGELKACRGNYQITGKAIATLEQYQIEVARAKSDSRSQKSIVILTIILVVFTAFQANLIEISYKLNINRVIEWLLK